MAIPQLGELLTIAAEQISFHGAIDIAEVWAESAVDFRDGASVFPENAAVLPQRPIAPDIILFR
jgi:hypothetical protein